LSKQKVKLYFANLHGTELDKKQYKCLRNSLTHKKEQAKREYYSKIIIETKHITKLLWKTIIEYKYKTKTSITHLINEVGDIITESTKINNMFNTYFSNIGQDLAANNIENPDSLCTMTCTSVIPQQYNLLYLKPITKSEVFR